MGAKKASKLNSNTSKANFIFFVFAVSLILTAVSLIASYRGLSVLPEGPGRRIAEAARSLWESGSLQAPEFKEIDQQAKNYSKQIAGQVWQDAFAIGKDKQLYPKHSLISVFLSALFYGFFGDWGFLLFNLLTVMCLFYFSYRINSYICKRDMGIETIIVVTLFTQTFFYIYAFSYDLLGAALLVFGLHLIRTKPFWGAFSAGLTIFVRPSHILLYPFVILAWPFNGHWQKRVFLAISGLSVVLALFALSNYLLWGDPLTLSYQRLAIYDNGNTLFDTHFIGFKLDLLLSDWESKLLSLKNGLLIYNPFVFLFPVVLVYSFKHAHRQFLLVMITLSVVYSVYIFSYEYWTSTNFGNRFLFPAIYAYLFPFMNFIDRLLISRKTTTTCPS